MAKRKKQSSKVQKRKGANTRPKARKLSKAAQGKAAKQTVAKAKPKRAPVKKAVRKERMKQPVALAVETVTVEHPAPEFEEVSQVSPGPDEREE
jgi:hypothetical protein